MKKVTYPDGTFRFVDEDQERMRYYGTSYSSRKFYENFNSWWNTYARNDLCNYECCKDAWNAARKLENYEKI